MSVLEETIMQQVRQLSPEQQADVLKYINQVNQTPSTKPMSPVEIMRLPLAERQRILQASMQAAADEDFEVFEANTDEDFDDHD
jgi:hypothetical protein